VAISPHRHAVSGLRAAACLVVGLAAGACAQQYHEASWPDLVTARQQDAIDREWVPAFLPEAARDIRQRNEPATGARIVVATLPDDVAVPECDGQSDEPVPLDASWLPDDPGDALACEDGWTLARNGDQVTLWNVGGLEVVE